MAYEIWTQDKLGRPYDLIEPQIKDVNFSTVAGHLAGVYRYAGGGRYDVSVALHLIIGVEACEPEIAPYWLLHDGAEFILGDQTTPYKDAMEYIANRIAKDGGAIVREAQAELTRIHDEVIHAAAGLPMPTAEIHAEIKRIDRVALVTERRDFLAPQQRSWSPEIEATAPLKRRVKWLNQTDAAARLYREFRTYLPVYHAANAPHLKTVEM